MPDLWLKFYPKDWNGDHQLRMCSLAARGLWASFLEPMHTATPYGYLLVNGKPPSYEDLARLASCKVREVKYGIEELVKNGVASVRPGDGVLYSRRMVRDAERLQKRRSGGALGGHPKLTNQYNEPGYLYLVQRVSDGAIKIGISRDPSKRLYALRMKFTGDELIPLDSAHVADMGAAEARLHRRFRPLAQGGDGEWFVLSDVDKSSLYQEVILLKEKASMKPPPIASSDLVSGSPSEKENEDESLDVLLDRFLREHYPPEGYAAGWETDQAWSAAFEGEDVQARYQTLVEAVTQHKRSQLWQEGKIPLVSRWLKEKRWNQRLREITPDKTTRHSQFLGANAGAEIADL